MRSDHDRLQDILDCAERIARHEQIGEPGDLVLDAILHNLVVIGEAVRGLSEGCRDREPGVRWSAIVGMRNLLAHEYFRIEYSHVRDVIEVHVPDLAEAARRLLSALGETDETLDILSQQVALEEIRESLEDIAAGRTVSIGEVMREFEQRFASEGSDGLATRSSAALLREDRESH